MYIYTYTYTYIQTGAQIRVRREAGQVRFICYKEIINNNTMFIIPIFKVFSREFFKEIYMLSHVRLRLKFKKGQKRVKRVKKGKKGQKRVKKGKKGQKKGQCSKKYV
jgi:hypothetical protein